MKVMWLAGNCLTDEAREPVLGFPMVKGKEPETRLDPLSEMM